MGTLTVTSFKINFVDSAQTLSDYIWDSPFHWRRWGFGTEVDVYLPIVRNMLPTESSGGQVANPIVPPFFVTLRISSIASSG